MKKLKVLVVAVSAAMLSSCDLSQIPGLDGKMSIEDSKAVGAACRHSGRALEDCFTLNPNTHQAGVFDGWRDMNDYMLANQIDVVKPEIRNSAFKPDKVSLGHSAPDTPAQPGSDPTGESVDAVPLAQGRQRWSPKGVAEPEADAPEAEKAVQAPKDVPKDVIKEATKEAPAAAEAPTADEPARPWERKKDPKKHT